MLDVGGIDADFERVFGRKCRLPRPPILHHLVLLPQLTPNRFAPREVVHTTVPEPGNHFRLITRTVVLVVPTGPTAITIHASKLSRLVFPRG